MLKENKHTHTNRQTLSFQKVGATLEEVPFVLRPLLPVTAGQSFTVKCKPQEVFAVFQVVTTVVNRVVDLQLAHHTMIHALLGA